MTLPIQIPRVVFTADGVQDTFPYDYLVLEETDMTVYENDTLTTKAYTVTGTGNISGGTVVFSPEVPAAGVTVALVLDVPLDQQTDYQPYDPFPAQTHEAALDKLTQQNQQQQDGIDRSVKYDVDSTQTEPPFLSEPLRNAILQWEDTADPNKIINGPSVSEVEQWKDDAEAAAIAAAASASDAAISATNAQNSEDAAEAALNEFTNQYLGPKPTDPTVDNSGNPLDPGDLYWNTSVSEMRVYTGSTWISVYDPAGYLPLIGGTLTGPILIEKDYVSDTELAAYRLHCPNGGPTDDVSKFVQVYSAKGFDGIQGESQGADRAQWFFECDTFNNPDQPEIYIGVRNLAGARLNLMIVKADGNLRLVTGNPIEPDDATTKGYVDGLIAQSMGYRFELVEDNTAIDETKNRGRGFALATGITAAGMDVGNNGSDIYIVDAAGTPQIRQYSMFTPWDTITANRTANTLNPTAEDLTPGGVTISTDGTQLFVLGTTNNAVYQYTLSTPFDLSTATYAAKSLSVTAQTTQPGDVTIASDGLSIYVSALSNAAIYKYVMSVANDISTATFSQTYDLLSLGFSSPYAITISEDGTKLGYIGNGFIATSVLSTPYDLTTATLLTESPFYVGGFDPFPKGMFFKDDGEYAYFVTGTDFIVQFYLNDPYNTQYVTFRQKWFSPYRQITNGSGVIYDVRYSDDGTKLYFIATGIPITVKEIHQYSLSKPFDVHSATYDSSASVAAEVVGTPVAFQFRPDGKKVFVMGDGASAALYQYSLGTAWDISTLVYDAVSLPLSVQSTTQKGLYFSYDGRNIYITAGTSGWRYGLASGQSWNIAGGSYSGDTFDFTPQDIDPRVMIFHDRQRKYWMLGGNSNEIHEYTIDASLNISTSVYQTAKDRNLSIITSSPENMSIGEYNKTLLLLSAGSKAAVQLPIAVSIPPYN